MGRVDERLGLAVCRVGLSPRTLVTYARDHVSVRTPSRPDLLDGNTLDLESVPAAEDLTGWVERFEDTISTIGAPHVRLRWEVPLSAEEPARAPRPTEDLTRAASRLGLSLTPATVLMLDRLPQAPAAPGDPVPVAPPSHIAGGPVDRRWHAATVLYRYQQGDTPTQWRDVDHGEVAWKIDVQRELALAERCQVWLTMHHGGPVARLHVVHDHQGLAAVEDVIVHPVVRGRGVAAALIIEALRAHLHVDPGSRVGIVVPAGSVADRLARRIGFRPHATVWSADRREATTTGPGAGER